MCSVGVKNHTQWPKVTFPVPSSAVAVAAVCVVAAVISTSIWDKKEQRSQTEQKQVRQHASQPKGVNNKNVRKRKEVANKKGQHKDTHLHAFKARVERLQPHAGALCVVMYVCTTAIQPPESLAHLSECVGHTRVVAQREQRIRHTERRGATQADLRKRSTDKQVRKQRETRIEIHGRERKGKSSKQGERMPNNLKKDA